MAEFYMKLKHHAETVDLEIQIFIWPHVITTLIVSKNKVLRASLKLRTSKNHKRTVTHQQWRGGSFPTQRFKAYLSATVDHSLTV